MPERVTSENVDALLDGVDVVLDGSDNFPLRYLLNDACIKHAIPMVYAAIERFDGQVSVFDAGRQRGVAPCYRCLFPEPPPPEFAPNRSEAGVLVCCPAWPGAAGHRGAEAAAGHWRAAGGAAAALRCVGHALPRDRHPAGPALPVCAPGVPFPGISITPRSAGVGEAGWDSSTHGVDLPARRLCVIHAWRGSTGALRLCVIHAWRGSTGAIRLCVIHAWRGSTGALRLCVIHAWRGEPSPCSAASGLGTKSSRAWARPLQRLATVSG